MTFKRVNDFATDDPDKLDRELSQLEDNIASEFALLRKDSAMQATVATFVASASRGIVAVQPDQQLSVDTFIANAAVVFPPLTPTNYGRRFVIIKRVAGGSIVTSCQTPSVLCNGATFPTITAVGAIVFYCDSSGYYK